MPVGRGEGATKGTSMKTKWKKVFFAFAFTVTITLTLTSANPQTKDPERIYKVAILPFLIHSQENLDYLREGIYDILSSRITAEGKIVTIERSIVERALHEERPMRLDETVAKNIGRRVGADFIVLGSVTKIGDYISLDARLISITDEKPPLGVYTQHKGIDDAMVKIGNFAEEIGYRILGRRAMASRPPDRGQSPIIRSRDDLAIKKSQTLETEIRGIDIGDVDGDKKNEVVVMDSHNLYIFRYDGERLTLAWKVEHGNEHNFLSLDVVDLNRNGHAEIIVTSVVEDDLRSFILEYEEREFRKIHEKTGWYFRVLDYPKDGPILMGQKMGSDGLLVDPIYQMVWKKKSYEKGPKMPFPKGTKIFGLAMGDLRKTGKPELIFLDSFDRLNIISQDGKTIWKSNDRFGGTDLFYDTKKKKPEAYRPQEAPPWRVYIPGRIVVRDLDGDGVPEVIINRNVFLTGRLFDKIRIPEGGDVVDLVWEEDILQTTWKTRQIEGYISDFQVKDADNDGVPELLVAVQASVEESISGVMSTKTRSNILFIKLF
jgi:TolB-like protein